MKKRAARPTGYAKVSATLETPVLQRIRERTTNVSGFLNEAAKRQLYFDRLRALDDELAAQGVERDERLYRNLKAWVREVEARRGRRGRAGAR